MIPIIKPYNESYLSQLERIDAFIVLQLKYHGGIKAENVFCAIVNDIVVGVGMLIIFQGSRAEFSVYSDDPDVKQALIERLITRFIELRKESDSKLVLRVCRFSNEFDDIQFLLSKGFRTDSTILFLKRDLSGEISHYPIPDDVEIRPYEFDNESMLKYIKAAEDSGLLPLKDIHDSWFRTGAPGFACYTAFYKDDIVGSVTIFDVSEVRAATEFIFVAPIYRRKNIARELIATALFESRSRGKKEASLTVYGSNSPAINLYLSMGYSLAGSLIELKLS